MNRIMRDAAMAALPKSAQICGYPQLARSVLSIRHRGLHHLWEENMARFESFAFAISFAMIGIITFAALPLA